MEIKECCSFADSRTGTELSGKENDHGRKSGNGQEESKMSSKASGESKLEKGSPKIEKSKSLKEEQSTSEEKSNKRAKSLFEKARTGIAMFLAEFLATCIFTYVAKGSDAQVILGRHFVEVENGINDSATGELT